MLNKYQKIPFLVLCCFPLLSGWVIFENNFLLSPEERGKLIYQKGESGGALPITAIMSGIEIPASVLPCASCHGLDGLGKPEGGVRPSNITWTALTTPYKGERKNGRSHPAYENKDLKRAISLGLDPAGNKLHNTMPKYKMSHQSMNDLVAYIKILGSESLAGITDTSIQIAWLPLLNESLKEVNEVQKAITNAYFSEVNAKGGIYNRSLKLRDYDDTETNEPPSFAMVGSTSFTPYEWSDDLKLPNIPLIAGVAPQSKEGAFLNDNSFFVYPDLLDQFIIFANDLVKKQPDNEKFTLIIETAEIGTDGTKIIQHFQQLGLNVFLVSSKDSDLKTIFKKINQQQLEKVLLLVSANLEKLFLAEMQSQNSTLSLLLPGIHSQTRIFELPAFFDNKISLIYPSWTTMLSEKGLIYFKQLLQKHRLSPKYKQSQLTALTVAIITVEGLKLSGRNLTHESFINQLESFYKFQTAYSPSISFTKNKHVGSDKLFIIKYLGKENGMVLDYETGI